MENVGQLLEEIARLMQLKGENPFKTRAFEKAAGVLAECPDVQARARAGTLTDLPGVGKGIAEVVTEWVREGKSTVLQDLQASLPAGLLELTEIPGLGPKKALQLIDELGIHSVVELEYACRENRLTSLKGFGEKIQKKIMEGIAFRKAGQGFQRLSDVLPLAERLIGYLREAHPGIQITETGALRRRVEILNQLDLLVELPQVGKPEAILLGIEKSVEAFKKAERHLSALPVRLHETSRETFGYDWAKTTATGEHWAALGSPAPFGAVTEEKFFEKFDLPFLPPETRESGEEVRLAQKGQLKDLLPWGGIRGVFHNHTVFSDGVATLEEMVLAAKNLGYEYIGISDHSQSAFYARGLKPEDLLAQEKEIRRVQEKYPEIRIFWGIESDILADGSLDYEPKWLKKFDFVIASIHSRFQMDREAMTDRILEAIRNPYTRFLGHMTGRLLLGRQGYELDIEKVIAEAASRDVAIEINANPARLDIDWRWGPELRKRKTLVSVNPDAHEVAGLADTVFGVSVARKALLPRQLVVNSRSAEEVAQWLRRE